MAYYRDEKLAQGPPMGFQGSAGTRQAAEVGFPSGRPAYVADSFAHVRRDLHLKADLSEAITNREIVPYYQPIIDLGSGFISGMEVLARWNHPEEGLISPQIFIPMAEAQKLCSLLTLSLMEQAQADAEDWPHCWRYAFNISPFELTSVMAFVQSEEHLSGFRAPRLLELEVTETALIQDSRLMNRLIEAVRPLGVDVALDDFGTGYANFQHLRDVPFSRLKLDKSFITNMAADHRSQECARAIIALAHSLGMSAHAEGVETEDVADRLVSLGCDFAQGYYFARPLPAPAVRFIKERSWRGHAASPVWQCAVPCHYESCVEAAD